MKTRMGVGPRYLFERMSVWEAMNILSIAPKELECFISIVENRTSRVIINNSKGTVEMQRNVLSVYEKGSVSLSFEELSPVLHFFLDLFCREIPTIMSRMGFEAGKMNYVFEFMSVFEALTVLILSGGQESRMTIIDLDPPRVLVDNHTGSPEEQKRILLGYDRATVSLVFRKLTPVLEFLFACCEVRG